ncbi:MAG: AmmeMemoRadiSam system protein B, partial [Magnetococcales bacterium]|nr:AmmeMemoRadiSam system protein B [Magnetococcales bacterium]
MIRRGEKVLRKYLSIMLLIVLGATAGLYILRERLQQEADSMNNAHASASPLPGEMATRIRPAAVAGAWYPGRAEELAAYLDQAMDHANPPHPDGKGAIRALIAPHAGYRYSGATAAAAFKLVRGRPLRRVIVLGPSHRMAFQGVSIPDVTHFATPLGNIPLDLQAIAMLRSNPQFRTLATAHQAEHSIEIVLPFLQRALSGAWQMVPILVGNLDAHGVAQIAELLRPLADDSTLVVVSTDFTHFGSNYDFHPFPNDAQLPDRIRELDQGAIDHILRLDGPGLLNYKQRTQITACGLLPMAILLHMLGEGTTPTLLQYDTSGNMTHDFTNSVSYT